MGENGLNRCCCRYVRREIIWDEGVRPAILLDNHLIQSRESSGPPLSHHLCDPGWLCPDGLLPLLCGLPLCNIDKAKFRLWV